MSKKSNSQEDLNQDDSFVLISSNSLKRLEEKIDSISEKLNGSKPQQDLIQGLLSEKQAMEKFGRSHTWFWEKRKSMLLNYSKLGKTIYYKEEELLKLIQTIID